MARSVQSIKATIMANIAADPILGNILTTTSLTSIFGLFAYVVAAIQNLLEQTWDDYLVQIKTNAAQSPANNEVFMQRQVFAYQYDPNTVGTSPTNLLTILGNGSVGYATVDPQFNIVTRCVIEVSGNNNVQVKVAQGSNPFSIISGAAFTQLQDYITNVGTAGIIYDLTSVAPDNLYLKGTIYYKSGYGNVAKTNVTNALNAYLNKLGTYPNYVGLIKVSDIIDVIMNAEGVADFVPTKVACRADATPFANTTVIYDIGNGINNRSYILTSAWAIMENTTGQGWFDPNNLELQSA